MEGHAHAIDSRGSDGVSRILLVEDDPDRVAVFREELDGREMEVAATAQEALRLLTGPRYDLVFLDHDLEGGARVYIDPEEPGTGYQVAKHLAERPEYRGVPVVVHSYNWFGGNKIVKLLPNAVYVPFGMYSVAEVARLFLDAGLEPGMGNAGEILGKGTGQEEES